MEWQQILESRSTTYAWEDTVPSKQLIDEIIQELHDHCPSKQRKVPYYIDVIDNTDPNVRPNAHDILLKNKSFAVEQVVAFVSQHARTAEGLYSGYQYDSAKCTRDVGYVIDGYLNDLRYDTNEQTLKIGNRYWKNGVSRVRQFAEIDAHNYLKDLIANYILPQIAAPTNQSVALQIIDNTNSSEEGSVDHFNLCATEFINIVQTGPSTATPLTGVPRLRFKIFETADRKAKGKMDDIRNPQLLAPWILAFSFRFLDDDGINLNHEMKNATYNKQVMQNEIGIASMFAMLSAHAKGLDTGFCACIQDHPGISKMLGHDIENEVIVFMGIGHKKQGATQYYSPLIHKMVGIPNKDVDNKPELSTYVRYHLGL
jgi:hypothetical protein